MYFAVADAGCADAHALACALDDGVDSLQIQVPTPLRDVVGVADAMTELRPTATDFTDFCHKNTLPLCSCRAASGTTVADGRPGMQSRVRTP